MQVYVCGLESFGSKEQKVKSQSQSLIAVALYW